MQASSYVVLSPPGNNTGLGLQTVLLDSAGVKAFNPAKVRQNENIIHDKILINQILVAATVSSILHIIAEGRWEVDSVKTFQATGSTSGTVMPTVDTAGTAPGAGTAQLTAALSLAAATDDVVQSGILIAAPTVAGPGDRISILIGGAMANLVGGAISIALKRVG